MAGVVAEFHYVKGFIIVNDNHEMAPAGTSVALYEHIALGSLQAIIGLIF